ncbi:hypothetical protein BHC51_04835 [Snodgrassella alvi]|nr:hypothetical protein BHC51_04835 [Snodgrassella alvi]
MDNFLNWCSVEKDGKPKKSGKYLIRVKFSYPFEDVPPTAFMDYYCNIKGEWRKYDSEARNITHYIPLSEIPMPK